MAAGCAFPALPGDTEQRPAATPDHTPAPSAERKPGSTDGGATKDPAPRAQNLDIEAVHPNGMTLALRKLTFTGNDIYLDVEVNNASRYECTIHMGNVTGERLRLVDDAGQEYNFVEPDGDKPIISVVPGETLEGTLAFRGPLRGEPEQLMLVSNVYPREIADFDLRSESDTSVFPKFVVPIDLVRT
jgi:hypothetical protein